jgi:ABC-type branched-subunit amino acid transport system substrate-binding protein
MKYATKVILMQRLVFGWLGMIAITLCGCGGAEAPYTDTSQDSAAYAKNVKELAIVCASEAKNSPEPADSISPLVEELKQTDRPHGEHAAKYSEMLVVAEAIVAEGNPTSGKATTTQLQKIDELAKLAEGLPGEVTIQRPAGD